MNRYTLHVKAVPAFKVGDRVRMRDNTRQDVGTVIEINGFDIHVIWDYLKKYGADSPGVVRTEDIWHE